MGGNWIMSDKEDARGNEIMMLEMRKCSKQQKYFQKQCFS